MTLSDFFANFGALIVAFLALSGTVYSIYSRKGVTKAETADRLASASTTTIDNLTEEIARLNLKAAAILLTTTDSKTAAKRSLELVARLLQGVNVLLAQVRAAGMSPDWAPDPEIQRLVDLCTAESDRLAIPRVPLAVTTTPMETP